MAGTLLSATRWPCESGRRWHVFREAAGTEDAGGGAQGGLGAAYEPDSCDHRPCWEGWSGRAHGNSGGPEGRRSPCPIPQGRKRAPEVRELDRGAQLGPGGASASGSCPRLRPLGHPSSRRAGPGTQGHGWRDPPGSVARSGVRRQPACCGMGGGRAPGGGGGSSLPCTDVETGPQEEWGHTGGLGGHPWPHPVREPGANSSIGLDHG